MLQDVSLFIGEMSRDAFYNGFVKRVGKTHEFAALATIKAKNLTDDEKNEVRRLLSTHLKFPYYLMDNDDKLDDIAAVASARAVTLR